MMEWVLGHKFVTTIGYSKVGPAGCAVDAAFSVTPGEWTWLKVGEGEGEYLHARDKRPRLWWQVVEWVPEGSLVLLHGRVGIAGVGADPFRTAFQTYRVAGAADVLAVRWPGVTLPYEEIPSLKGRLRHVRSRTLAEERGDVLSPSARAIAFLLFGLGQPKVGPCSIRWLCQEAKLSVRSVYRAMRELEEKRVIRVADVARTERGEKGFVFALQNPRNWESRAWGGDPAAAEEQLLWGAVSLEAVQAFGGSASRP